MINLKGQDVDDALRSWIKKDVEGISNREFELGKFFFTVSTGSAGVFLSILKLSSTVKVDMYFYSSMALMFISLVLAIGMAMPVKRKLDGETDLQDVYNQTHTEILRCSYWWFGLWIASLLLGWIAVTPK